MFLSVRAANWGSGNFAARRCCIRCRCIRRALLLAHSSAIARPSLAWPPPSAAERVPGEVIIRYAPDATRPSAPRRPRAAGLADGTPSARARASCGSPTATRGRDARRAAPAARRRAATRTTSPAPPASPTTPGSAACPADGRACSGTSRAGHGRQRARRVGEPRARRPAGRPGRHGRGARHGRRLPRRAAATCGRRTSRATQFHAATTSSTATRTPTTRTATGRTSPPRSPSAMDNGGRRDGPGLRRADHARARAGRLGARATSPTIARGIRYAARRGAQVINLSLRVRGATSRPRDIPEILARCATPRAADVLVVGAAGNASATALAYPARAPRGAVRRRRRPSTAARPATPTAASALDLVAPGGGSDAALPDDPQLPTRPGPRAGTSSR